MSFKEFNNDLKNGILGNAIFMYGEEGFLTDWALKTVIDRISTPEDRKYVVTDFDGERVTAQEIVETANTMTMFAGTRVLTVKNYSPLIKKSVVSETATILEYLSCPNPATIIVFSLDRGHSPGKRDKLNAFATKVNRDDDEDVLKRDPDRLKKVGVAEDKREVGEAEAGIRAG